MYKIISLSFLGLIDLKSTNRWRPIWEGGVK